MLSSPEQCERVSCPRNDVQSCTTVRRVLAFETLPRYPESGSLDVYLSVCGYYEKNYYHTRTVCRTDLCSSRFIFKWLTFQSISDAVLSTQWPQDWRGKRPESSVSFDVNPFRPSRSNFSYGGCNINFIYNYVNSWWQCNARLSYTTRIIYAMWKIWLYYRVTRGLRMELHSTDNSSKTVV